MTFVNAPHTPYVTQSIMDSPAVLIMLDRFDRYADKVDLKMLAKPDRVVLVDWKYPPKIGPVPFDVAFVNLRKDGILIEM